MRCLLHCFANHVQQKEGERRKDRKREGEHAMRTKEEERKEEKKGAEREKERSKSQIMLVNRKHDDWHCFFF